MKKKTIIYGNGEFAHHVHQNIIDQGELEISAFTADRAFIKERTLRGLPVVDFEEVENLSPGEFSMLVVIAYWRMRNREVMFNSKARATRWRIDGHTPAMSSGRTT